MKLPRARVATRAVTGTTQTMKISAAVLWATKEPFRIEQVELEEPHAGEVLVKIAAVGICHSDWHLATGATKHPLPVIAGHEGAGVVQAVVSLPAGWGVVAERPGVRLGVRAVLGGPLLR